MTGGFICSLIEGSLQGRNPWPPLTCLGGTFQAQDIQPDPAAECLVSTVAEHTTPSRASVTPLAELKVALLTGGIDRPYAFGLAMALVSKGVRLDVIGSDGVDSPEMHTCHGLKFLNLLRMQERRETPVGKAVRLLQNYVRLIRYAAGAQAEVFHILWNSKIELFDRTLDRKSVV